MVIVNNRAGATKSLVATERFITESDTTPPAGKGAGFRPHELLEAALASCTAIKTLSKQLSFSEAEPLR